MSYPSQRSRAKLPYRACIRCTFWGKPNIVYSGEERPCVHPDSQLTRPTVPWDVCALYKHRRKLPPAPTKARMKGVSYKVDPENKKIFVEIDYSYNYGLSQSKGSYLFAMCQKAVPESKEHLRLNISLSRPLTKEEKLKLALMGRAFATKAKEKK